MKSQDDNGNTHPDGNRTGRPVAIAVAPVGGWGIGEGNPLEPQAAAEAVRRCADEGGCMVHLHARTLEGKLTADTSVFTETLNEIRRVTPEILIEASTGGLSDLTREERANPLAAEHVEAGSLNMGSLNFGDEVYRNRVPDIRYWISRMVELGVHPSLEIFDTGNLATALSLIEEGVLKPPYFFNLIFDAKWGMPFSTSLAAALVEMLPAGSVWGAVFVGSRGFGKHLECARMGASLLRTGFEDSPLLTAGAKKVKAANNRELVQTLRLELEREGFKIATADTVRGMMSVQSIRK